MLSFLWQVFAKSIVVFPTPRRRKLIKARGKCLKTCGLKDKTGVGGGASSIRRLPTSTAGECCDYFL